jgi:hypothetical protein
MTKRERMVILILLSTIILSGFVILSQRNSFIDLNNKYTILETKYNSLVQNQTEAQQCLESQIVYEALKIALIEEKIPTFGSLIYNTSTVILSTEHIEEVNIPKQIGRYTLLLMNSKEIEEKAKAEGPFLYLIFTKFELNPEYFLVSIQTSGIFDSGGGMTVQYKFIGTVSQVWIN